LQEDLIVLTDFLCIRRSQAANAGWTAVAACWRRGWAYVLLLPALVRMLTSFCCSDELGHHPSASVVELASRCGHGGGRAASGAPRAASKVQPVDLLLLVLEFLLIASHSRGSFVQRYREAKSE
jgi:hypothetical protein